jgi:hypothetical protein
MDVCAWCEEPIAEEPYWNWVFYQGMTEPRFLPAHMECTPNSERPKEFMVCDVCGIQGADDKGEFCGEWDFKIQHPSHVDWDAVQDLNAMRWE